MALAIEVYGFEMSSIYSAVAFFCLYSCSWSCFSFIVGVAMTFFGVGSFLAKCLASGDGDFFLALTGGWIGSFGTVDLMGAICAVLDGSIL